MGLLRVELEERTVHFNRETDVVEHEELGFRAEEHVGADAAVLDELLRLFGGAARIAGVELAGDRVLDVTEDDQLWLRCEGVHDRRVHIGHEQHIGLVDGLPAGNRGAIEQNAFVKASSSMACSHMARCCSLPRGSVKRTSMYSTSFSSIIFLISA